MNDRRIPAPGIEQCPVLIRRPGRLPLVEVRGAVLPDLVRDEIGPGAARHRTGHCTRIDDVRHERHAREGRRLERRLRVEHPASDVGKARVTDG